MTNKSCNALYLICNKMELGFAIQSIDQIGNYTSSWI